MADNLVKTKTPGVYKRETRYVIRYRDGSGRPQWESCRTDDEARLLKRKRDTAVRGGELRRSQVTLHDYAQDWIARYQGPARVPRRDA